MNCSGIFENTGFLNLKTPEKMMHHLKNISKIIFFILFLALICLFFIPSATALDEKTASVNPVQNKIIWNEFILLSGKNPVLKEEVLNIDFHKKECFDSEGNLLSPMSGSKVIKRTLMPDREENWSVGVGLNSPAPGEYVLRVWIEDNPKQKQIKSAYVSTLPSGISKIEISDFEDGEEEHSLSTDTSTLHGIYTGFYEQNTYKTPGSQMNLFLKPDLSKNEGVIVKGESLAITGSIPKDNELLILICRPSFPDDFIYKKILTLEPNEKGFIKETEILSADETTGLLSAKYHIYAVSKKEGELNEIRINPTGIDPHYGFLKTQEDKNPWQMFTIILSEPGIEIDEDEDQFCFESGEIVKISGTTNLKAGTVLFAYINPTANPDDKKLLSREIIVKQGKSVNTWSFEFRSKKTGTGEFMLSVLDVNGIASACKTINIFDKSYSGEKMDEGYLLVQSYKIDPVSKKLTEDMESAKKTPVFFGVSITGLLTGALILRLRTILKGEEKNSHKNIIEEI